MSKILEKQAGVLGKKELTCEDCKWAIDVGVSSVFECRRMPPNVDGRYPIVSTLTPFCGEYAIRPWRKGIPEDVLASNTITPEIVRSFLDRLDSRERLVLTMRLGLDGRARTIEEVSQAIGRTRERVLQIQNSALGKITHHCLNECKPEE